MKIALIGSRGIPANYGGIEKGIEEVAPRIAVLGHDVSVFCWKSNNLHAPDTYKGVRLVHVPTLQSKHFGNFICTARATLRTFGTDFDIIRYHALGPGLFSSVPRLRGTKTVVSVHGLDWKRKKWNAAAALFLKLCEAASVRFPHRTIVVSRSLQRYYSEKYGIAPAFIPNGITCLEPSRPHEIHALGLQGDDYILFLNRLEPEKGVEYLIDAFAQLATDKKLVIAGDGPQLESLREQHAGNPGILFPGFVRGSLKHELYSNAYLFVLPSEIEGMSNALLEAMSYGLCCVTSDIQENRELISGSGFSFKNKSSQNLSALLSNLLVHKERVRESGQRAREHVQSNYSWDSVVVKTLDLYRDLLST